VRQNVARAQTFVLAASRLSGGLKRSGTFVGEVARFQCCQLAEFSAAEVKRPRGLIEAEVFCEATAASFAFYSMASQNTCLHLV